MQTIHLEQRLSHRYVDTYDHLDEWQDIGTAKLTPPKAFDFTTAERVVITKEDLKQREL